MTDIGRLLFITLALFAAQVQVMAAAIVVEGDCTLPAAIASANRDEAVGGCDAGADADTISLSGPVSLAAPLPPIMSEITIAGGGYTISGNGAHRIFLVEEAGSLTIRDLTMVDGSVSSRGGAIYNLGTLNVFDSAFRDSQARRFGGAIANWGEATVKDSSFNANASRYGGAIYNRANATITIEGGSFRENAAQADDALTGIESNPATNLFGGAIYNQGSATIRNTNFGGNRASADGGALWNIGTATISETYFSGNNAVNDGGAIANVGDLTIDGSAFSHNRAGGNFGGAIANWGMLQVTGSDFTSNELASAAGAAIANWGDAEIEDSQFIANATASQGGAIFTVGETQISGSTFRDNTSEHGGAIINQEGGRAEITDSEFTGNATTNQGGAIYSAVDSDVTLAGSKFSENVAEGGGGALYSDGKVGISGSHFRDNSSDRFGGAVVSGSELNISDSVFRDNRSQDGEGGGIRHFGNRLELDEATKFANNNGGDCVGPACADVDIVVTDSCTLADAIGAANNDSPYGGCPAGAGADIIGLPADITLAAALPEITSDITIEGEDKTIDGASTYRIFTVAATGNLTVNRLTLANGQASGEGSAGWGGAILNYGTLTATESVFQSNFASYGGAIDNEVGGTSVIRDSQFLGNSASGHGGAIFNEADGTSLTVEGGLFGGNSANYGGAIGNNGAARLSGVQFRENEATAGGGGIDNWGVAADMRVMDSAFIDNSAAEGGAILNREEGRLSQSGSSFSGNTADDCVGAGCVAVDMMASDICELADAIEAANTDSAVGGCPAGDGADVIGLTSDITLAAALPAIRSVIKIAGEGRTIDGAGSFRIFTVEASGELDVHWLTMQNGSATGAAQGDGWGGAILNLGKLAVSKSAFRDNSGVYGGAIDNEDNGSSVVRDSVFSGNSATSKGGAIFNEDVGTSFIVTDSEFSGNSSPEGGAFNNSGVASVSGSRFNDNEATNSGGAIHNAGESSQLSVSDSVFEGNSAAEGGALYDDAGTMQQSDNTFALNTGGDCVGSSCVPGDIVVSSLCALSDAITAANTDSATGGCPAGSGADSIGLSADITLDAALPPITSEITILGHDKTIDGAESFRIFTVAAEGALTITDLTLANGLASGSGSAAWGGAILNYGRLSVNESNFVNNAAQYGGAIENEDGGTVVIANGAFSGNSAAKGGGAIFNENTDTSFTVTASQFSGNSAEDGGAISNIGVASVSGSQFDENSASADGGAIHNSGAGARLSVTENAFSDNNAVQGGDIFNGNGGALVERSGNTPPAGGGLDCVGPGCTDELVVNATCSLADAIAAANTDATTGGCPAGDGADTITLARDVTLSSALPEIASEITIEGSGHTISGNDRYRIFYVQRSGNLTINESTLRNGKTRRQCEDDNGGEGGALCNRGTVTITNSVLRDNSVGDDGGAIYNRSTGTITIANTEFHNNSADDDGGAIFNYQGTISVRDSEFTGNRAGDDGGAIRRDGGTVNVSGSTFSNNRPQNCYDVTCPTSANHIAYGDSVSGRITSSVQEIEYVFEARSGDRVTIAMNKSSGSSLDPYLRLRNSSGSQVTSNDDGGSGNNALIDSYRLSSAGAYTISAESYGSSTGSFTLRLSRG